MQILSDELQKESDLLAEKYFLDDEGLSMKEYRKKYGSQKLNKFLDDYLAACEEGLKNREIID